mgnify:CR=1 FL=1
MLLKVGSKATDENAEGYTALHLAAKNGHVKVLGVLKEQSTAHWKVCSRRVSKLVKLFKYLKFKIIHFRLD